MASSFRCLLCVDYFQLTSVLCLLLWCFPISQVVGHSEDELPNLMGVNIERLTYSASLLRSNMVQPLRTILQHPETEEQLTWEQQAVIQWLHDSLTSRETNIVQLLLDVQMILQSQTAITAEQETSILFTLLSQSSSITFQWKKIMSMLKSYSIGPMLKGLPEGLKQNEHSELAYIINLNKKTFFESILKNIQHSYITLTSSLLVGLLNHIPLHCLCPETHEVLHNVPEELLHKQNKLNSLLPRITVKPQQNISDFLLKVLNLLQSEESPLHLSVKRQIWKIIPLIKPGVCKNVKPQLLTVSHKYNELFLAIRDDKFPCDIISARDSLMFAIKSGKLDLTKYSDGFIPTFYGNDCLSVLFAFLSRLSFSLPNALPASAYAHTLFSYVKMKYNISNAGSFIPTVPLDIAVLLNSFNPMGTDFSEINTEIYHAFQEEIKWKKILQDFPFSQYTQPRSLFMAMLHKVFHTDTKLKLSHQIILKYFLEKVQNTLHQYQHLQISESEIKFNPFVNPTTQLKQLKPPILSQPVNVINETLPTVVEKLSAETQITTVIKSPTQQCENTHSIQSCVNSTDSVIQLFNILSQKNKTKFSVTCTEQQEKVYLPNIKSLLKAVDENVPHQSITLISDYFETTDTGKILLGFHMENYKTQGELLTQMLKFMKSNLVHIQTRVLHAIDEILLHIKLDGLGALKPEMMDMCLDVSTAKTRMSATNSSTIHRAEKSSQTTHLITSSGKETMESTTLEYEDTASTTVETITSINLQSNTIIVSPPTHVTFPETETPYTNEVTISQIKTSSYPSLGYDTESITIEPTTSTNLKPTTIKSLPTHVTFPETESLSADKVTTSKSKTTKNTSEYDDRESILAETTASINMQPITITVYPPTHVTFLKTETSSTDEATTPQLETTKYTSGYDDTESTTLETTSIKLQPTTITISPQIHTTFPDTETLSTDKSTTPLMETTRNITQGYDNTASTTMESTTSTGDQPIKITTFPSIHVTFPETETPSTDEETNSQTEITETTTVNVTSEDTNTATPSFPISDTEHTKLVTPTPITEQKVTSTLLYTSSDLHTTTSKTSYTEAMPTTITAELETTKENTKTEPTDTQTHIITATYIHDTNITGVMTEQNTTPLNTYTTETVTLPQLHLHFNHNKEREIYTLNCSNQQTIAKIPNIKSLLSTVLNNVSVQHIQFVINFFQKQEILHVLKIFDTKKYATKADMLSNVITFLNLTYTDFNYDVHDIFKNILSHIIFDGKLVTEHDYADLCLDRPLLTMNLPAQGHTFTDETQTARSATTKPITTQPSETSPSPSTTQSVEITSLLLNTSSSELSIPISCIDPNGETQIIPYNTTTLFDSLDYSTPNREKAMIMSYLTQSSTYNILEGLIDFYQNSHNMQDTEYNAPTFTTNGSLLKQVLLFLRNRTDVQHHILTAIDIVLPHIQSGGPSTIHFEATTICNSSDFNAGAESAPDLRRSISANKTLTTASPNIYMSVDTTVAPTQFSTVEKTLETSLPNISNSNIETLYEVYNFSMHEEIKHTAVKTIEECPENGKIRMYTIEVPSLFQAVKPGISRLLLKNVMDILNVPALQIKLKVLNWDQYNTKARLLEDILTYVVTNTTQTKEIIDSINQIISQIDVNGSGAHHPTFKFICAPNDTALQPGESDQSTLKPMVESCKSMLAVKIALLLKAVKTNTPRIPKALVTALLHNPNFYLSIADFKLDDFKTRGEQLQGLLTHLITEGKLEPVTYDAVKTLLNYVQLDGPGALPADTNIICRSPLNIPTAMPSGTTLHDDYINNRMIIIPSKCPDKQSLTGIPTVDLPTLFTAIDPNAPADLVSLVMNALSSPGIYQALLDYNWDDYETRSQLLKDLLSSVAVMTSEGNKVHKAAQKLLPYIRTFGVGMHAPVMVFECAAENATVLTVSKQTPVSNYCDEGVTSRKIIPLQTLNISSLFKALKPITPQEHIRVVSSYLSRLDFYKKTRGFRFEEHKTRGELLQELLAYLMEEVSMDGKTMEAISTLIQYVQLDGPGAEILDFNITCNVTLPSKLSQDLYDDSEEPQNENIRIDNKCFDNGTIQIITADVSPLVHIIDRPLMTLFQIKDILRAPGTQRKLKEFNWDAYHETRGELLKNIIDFLINTVSPKQQEYLFLNSAIPFIQMDQGAIPPSFIFSCITEEEELAQNDMIKNRIKLEDITGGPAILTPSHGQCNNEATPIFVVNIHPLFNALKPTTPPFPKAVVTAYVTKPHFYKKLSNFSLAIFKTRGEQLKELLTYLTEVSVDTTLMKATNKLLENVQLDGPGKLPPSVKVVCNTTLNKLTGIPLQKVEDILVTVTPITKQTQSTSVLAPCIQSSSGTTYQIDFPNIFYALKPNAPRTSLAKIVSLLTKPDIFTVLKNFNVEVHKTQGDLLASLLLFLMKKFNHQQHMTQAIQEILPFIRYNGLGSKPPNIIPSCALPDSKEVIIDEPYAIAEPSLTSQGPKLIDLDGNECMSLTPDSSHVQGTTAFKVDIQSLTKLLNNTALEQEPIAKMFASEYLQNSLRGLNLKNYFSRAELLKGMLSLLENYPHLTNNNLLLVKKTTSHIQFEGEGALPPLISALCTEDSVKPNPQYIMYATNETCFMPSEYSTTGMPYKLQTETLLQTIKPETPKNIANSVISFFKHDNVQLYFQGFNIFGYRTQGEIMRNLLLFLAIKPEIKLEYRKAMVTIVPYIHMDGPGALSPVIITTCPESQDNEKVTNQTSETDTEAYTENSHSTYSHAKFL